MNKWVKYITIITVLTYLVFISCQKDTFVLDGDVNVGFSVDTLRFDTVFTAVGSATKFFKIYNKNEGAIKISNIQLESNELSFFRLNVDGVPTNAIQDVEILPNDSIYVFAEVTVDPDMPLSASPFIIQEWVNVDVNGNSQRVLLEAWGQNANYIPSVGASGRTSVITCELGTIVFDDPKPYVIYGWLVIDSCEVVLPAGTEIFVHGGISRPDGVVVREEGLIGVLSQGKIIAEGTLEEPVIFKTDRLEDEFDSFGGQWSGVTLTTGSKGNVFNHTIIKNATDGLWLESGASVELNNTRISNTARFGIIGINASIKATNTLIHSNGANSIYLTQGGDYRFEYCTFANIGNEAEALYMDNIICQNDDCTEITISPIKSRFVNCIIAGDDKDEITFRDGSDGNLSSFDYFMQNTIVVIDELLDAGAYPNFFENCSKCKNINLMSDKLFLDIDKGIYSLDTMSVAEMGATPINTLQLDIDENMRDAMNPDIGCFEFQD